MGYLVLSMFYINDVVISVICFIDMGVVFYFVVMLLCGVLV